MYYVDFIDSPTLRDHLRTLPPLPPAQRCIIIAQSDIRSLEDKLAALREIRSSTPIEEFAHGRWKFWSDEPFPVILERYIETREQRLTTIRKPKPGIIYFVEDCNGWCGAPFSTFDAALASVKRISGDDDPPSIIRRPIDDPSGEILDASLSREREIVEIRSKRYHCVDTRRDRESDLPSGYAHVPHPFKYGDIVRQWESYYCVIAQNPKEDDGDLFKFSHEFNMELCTMTWDQKSGTFGHDAILFTRHGTTLVTPEDLPEKEKMLAAVSNVIQGKSDLASFLQKFTNGRSYSLE